VDLPGSIGIQPQLELLSHAHASVGRGTRQFNLEGPLERNQEHDDRDDDSQDHYARHDGGRFHPGMNVFVDHLAALLGCETLQPRMMPRMRVLRNEAVRTKMTDTHRHASYVGVIPRATFSLRLPGRGSNHLSSKPLTPPM
jgi:hypothetical protein